jgi:hypothetical protein
MNVGGELRTKLKGRPCTAFDSDLPTIDVTLSLAVVYDRVTFDEPDSLVQTDNDESSP